MSTLYIDRKGIELKLQGEVLVFYENDIRIGTVPLQPLSRIVLKGDIKLNVNLLAKLGEKGIGVIYLKGRKDIATLMLPQPHNDAARRVVQYAITFKANFCLKLSQRIVFLKLFNQKECLFKLINKSTKNAARIKIKADEIVNLMNKIVLQDKIESLRGLEGKAASYYFEGLSLLLPDSLQFSGRNRRPPMDPFNAVLSLGYTLLHSEAVLIAQTAGLEPFIGFYHNLSFARESLACDMIEPLRPLFDRWAYNCFQGKILRVEDFSTTEQGCRLAKAGRVRFYIEFEKAISQWRKILTENCLNLANLFKANQSKLLRGNSYINIELADEEIFFKKYFFNQLDLMKTL